MTYDPTLMRLSKISGATMVGWTFRLGSSRLGQTSDTRTDIQVSAIDFTDGYNTGSNGELSIDPVTGSASISEQLHPAVSDTVASKLPTPLAAGDRIEISYGQSIVQQCTVNPGITVRMDASGPYWIRKTTYQFAGAAGTMLANTVSWASVPQESPLTRLGRYFTVDTSLLSAAQITYLNGLSMPSGTAGSSTYLDLARAFSAATLFPVRATSMNPLAWQQISVIPAVTFQGALPPAAISNAETWSGGADFSDSAATAVEVVKNYDGFITGFTSQAQAGTPLGRFQLATSRIGQNFNVPFGIQVPVVIDAFGTRLIASKVAHSFTSSDYRSALELVPPVHVG